MSSSSETDKGKGKEKEESVFQNEKGELLLKNGEIDLSKLGTVSVEQALKVMALEKDLVDYLVSKQDMWATFGKMNSHMYRSILMKLMQKAGLNPEEKFMVFFLFGVIKNQVRVIKAMKEMPEMDRSQKWFDKVYQFINTQITQYVSDVKRSKKFPAVNIPTCNPGVDILVYCLITHPNDRSFGEMTYRPTFSQLALSADVQKFAKDGNQYYWDVIVQGSNNPDHVPEGLPKPMFREEYYKNAASDQYYLVDLNLEEVPPSNPNVGYSFEDLYKYLRSVDPKDEYDKDLALLEEEMNPERDVDTEPEQ